MQYPPIFSCKVQGFPENNGRHIFKVFCCYVSQLRGFAELVLTDESKAPYASNYAPLITIFLLKIHGIVSEFLQLQKKRYQ